MPIRGGRATLETRAKISAAGIGRVCTEETRAKLSKAIKGRETSAAHRAALSKANTGTKFSPERLAKAKLRRHTDKTKAMISAIKTGVSWGRHTTESKAKMSAASKGKPKSAEACAAMSAAKKGKPHSPAQLAALRAALDRPETRARMSASHIGKCSEASSVASSKRSESPQERLLHSALRRMSIRFEPHFPLLGRWVADVYLPDFNLLLEADGAYHHGDASWFSSTKQQNRDQAILRAGFKMQRIPNVKIEADAIAAVHWALQEAGVEEKEDENERLKLRLVQA